MSQMFYFCKALTTIYVASGANWGASDKLPNPCNMFKNCTKLVGGSGTQCDGSNNIDATRACIDGLNGQPGYFTKKQ